MASIDKALVEWTKDHDQYKKGEKFILSGPSLHEYVASGIVKIVSTDVVETAANEPQAETADQKTAKK